MVEGSVFDPVTPSSLHLPLPGIVSFLFLSGPTLPDFLRRVPGNGRGRTGPSSPVVVFGEKLGRVPGVGSGGRGVSRQDGRTPRIFDTHPSVSCLWDLETQESQGFRVGSDRGTGHRPPPPVRKYDEVLYDVPDEPEKPGIGPEEEEEEEGDAEHP